MFSRWIVMNITSARGTLHCRKTRIPCGQYSTHDDKPERWQEVNA
jgi:hypothetical protein